MKDKSSGATRLADLATGRTDMLNIPPAAIVVDPDFNYRDFRLPQNKEHVKDLKRLIKAANGVQQPLWVRFDPETKVPILVDGECRLRAVKELIAEGEEIKTVPCIQKSRLSEADRIVMSLTANGSKPPSQWEVGGAYKRLQGYGWTIADIAAKVGQTEEYVKAAIELDEAEPSVKQLLSEAAVTPAHVRGVIKKHGDGHRLIIESAVQAARKAAQEKQKAKEEKQKASGKKAKGRPAKEKPVKVTRPKKAGGRFIKDADLKLIQQALKAAMRSDDVDISTAAETALEILSGKKED